jgi:nicotinamidase-related amidase
MRESYFTTESLETKSGELLDSVSSYSKSHIPIIPDETALLVLDMQKHFLDPESHAFIPSAKAIYGNIFKLIQLFINLKRPVLLTRHLNRDENAGMMKKWWRDMITEENPLSEIDDEFLKYNLPVINKPQYDAFYETNLESILRDRKTGTVVITGVMTHLCCETTARSAFTKGFNVVFPVDGTATYNESFHRATLQNLAHGFARVMTVAELSDNLRQGNKSA